MDCGPHAADTSCQLQQYGFSGFPIFSHSPTVQQNTLLPLSPFNYLPFSSQIPSVPYRSSLLLYPRQHSSFFFQFFSSIWSILCSLKGIFPGWPRFYSQYIYNLISIIPQSDIFYLEHPYTCNQLHLCNLKRNQKYTCFLQSSVVSTEALSILSNCIDGTHYGLNRSWDLTKRDKKAYHWHKMHIIKKYFTFSFSCYLKGRCCFSTRSKIKWGGGKYKAEIKIHLLSI